MKPSPQLLTVSAIFVTTIAVLGVAIERQRAVPSSSLLSGPSLRVQPGAVPLCVPPRFVDPHELRIAVTEGLPLTGSPHGRVDLVAFSPGLTGLTEKQYEAVAVHGAYQGLPGWVRMTILGEGSAGKIDLEPTCGGSRCVVRTRLAPDGVRFDYAFPASLLRDWPALHSSAQKLVGEWAKDTSCRS
jgi:hypothetical protein